MFCKDAEETSLPMCGFQASEQIGVLIPKLTVFWLEVQGWLRTNLNTVGLQFVLFQENVLCVVVESSPQSVYSYSYCLPTDSRAR